MVSQFLAQFIKQLDLKPPSPKLQSLVTYAFKSQTIVSNLKSCMHLSSIVIFPKYCGDWTHLPCLPLTNPFKFWLFQWISKDWYDIVEKTTTWNALEIIKTNNPTCWKPISQKGLHRSSYEDRIWNAMFGIFLGHVWWVLLGWWKWKFEKWIITSWGGLRF